MNRLFTVLPLFELLNDEELEADPLEGDEAEEEEEDEASTTSSSFILVAQNAPDEVSLAHTALVKG